MFKSQDTDSNKYKEVETIIGRSVKVKGNFHGDGNVVIEGEVEGSVKTNNNLLVGNKAKIMASVKAKDARVGGEIRGNVTVSGFLELESSAKIYGDIKTSQLSIAKGAILNGQVNMGGDDGRHEQPKK